MISFQDALPLQDFFVVIDEHFTLRERLRALKNQLEQKTSQFRVIQKRMLTRFKANNFYFLKIIIKRIKTRPL